MVFSLSVIRSGPGHSAHRRLITGGLRLGVDQDCACADSDVLPHEVLWWVCTALPHSIRLVRHAGVWVLDSGSGCAWSTPAAGYWGRARRASIPVIAGLVCRGVIRLAAGTVRARGSS